jgi:hypothetical protein
LFQRLYSCSTLKVRWMLTRNYLVESKGSSAHLLFLLPEWLGRWS